MHPATDTAPTDEGQGPSAKPKTPDQLQTPYLTTTYTFGDAPSSRHAEVLVDVLAGVRVAAFSLSVVALALTASAIGAAGTHKQLFLLAMSVIIAIVYLFWLLVLPTLLGRSTSMTFGSKIRRARYTLPLSVACDGVFALLAFGAASAAAPGVGRVAAAVALMYLVSICLMLSLAYVAGMAMKHGLSSFDE